MELIKNEKPANFKHLCNPGDLLAAMAAMKAYHIKTGRKVRVIQMLDCPAHYYKDATHGTLDEKGTMVCMNQAMFNMIKPLVESQDYIHSMEAFNGQEVDVDLDVIRKQVFVNLPHGAIQQWVFMAYPDLAWDISKPWLELPEKDIPIVNWAKDKIILNFTERYRNGLINYFFLKKHERYLVFAGTEREYLLFTNRWGLDIPRLDVRDFLELAYALKNCRFLMSNQSMCWNASFGLKGRSILEYCEFAVNCQAFIGDGVYGFYHQVGVEYYTDLLINKTSPVSQGL